MEKRVQFRSYCYNRPKLNRCKFMLLSMKTEEQHYHVYKHGEHNHPVHSQKGKLDFIYQTQSFPFLH
jgi:hypothetical protein